jgi:hypothetical protein
MWLGTFRAVSKGNTVIGTYPQVARVQCYALPPHLFEHDFRNLVRCADGGASYLERGLYSEPWIRYTRL